MKLLFLTFLSVLIFPLFASAAAAARASAAPASAALASLARPAISQAAPRAVPAGEAALYAFKTSSAKKTGGKAGAKPAGKGGALLYWTSPGGLKRLSAAVCKADFAFLANEYQNQADGLICGPTTGAIVLNALRIRPESAGTASAEGAGGGGGKKGPSVRPIRPDSQTFKKRRGKKSGLPETPLEEKYKKHLPPGYSPGVKRWTPRNFMAKAGEKIKTLSQLYGEPVEGKKDFGLQLRQIHRIFQAHGARSKLRVVTQNLPDRTVREELKANLCRKEDFAVVNYKRSALGQKGGGHISPLGAYHQESDSFLIMDVNSAKYGWVWIEAPVLIRAMRTFDTQENRGYLLISE